MCIIRAGGIKIRHFLPFFPLSISLQDLDFLAAGKNREIRQLQDLPGS